jgi:hypothetical protein
MLWQDRNHEGDRHRNPNQWALCYGGSRHGQWKTVNMSKFLLTVCVFGLLLSFASAQEKRTLLGEGNASCGEWTRERQKTGLGSELRAWVRGYVTAANAYADTKFLTRTSIDAINIWIDDYCRSKPFEKLAQAVDALVVALHSQAVGRK